MTYKLSTKSLKKLEGVHPDLVAVVKRAIEITKQDFTVTAGVRTEEEQAALYAQGRTKPGPKVTWTMNSKHRVQNSGYGEAVDIPAYPVNWAGTKENLARFDAVATAMFTAARELGVKIRWGADWDGDGKPRERGESDSPHFELAR